MDVAIPGATSASVLHSIIGFRVLIFCLTLACSRSYLLQPQGGNLQSIQKGGEEVAELSRVKVLDTSVSAVCTLYAQMVSGEGIFLLYDK